MINKTKTIMVTKTIVIIKTNCSINTIMILVFN